MGSVCSFLVPIIYGRALAFSSLTDNKFKLIRFDDKMVELDVPAMIHVSGACQHAMDTTSSYYLGADTTAFVHLMFSDVFKDFPNLKIIIPHGGGAVPYHWGRFRGIAQDKGLGNLDDLVLNNVFFDTCVYHQHGIDLLLDVIPVKNILFAYLSFSFYPKNQLSNDHICKYLLLIVDYFYLNFFW